MGALDESQPLMKPEVVGVPADPKAGLPRSWRFPLWRVVGDGSTEDVVAGCMAWQLPLVAFGWNMKRSLQVCFWRELLKIVLVLVGAYLVLTIAAHALVYSCAGWPEPPADRMHGHGDPMHSDPMNANSADPSSPRGGDEHGHDPCILTMVHDLPAECRDNVIGGLAGIFVVAIAVVVTAVVYAARRRQQIREQFGIEGTFKGDLLSWLFCSVCALAQETRTLMVNQVHEGVWHGPMVNNANSVPAAQQMV